MKIDMFDSSFCLVIHFFLFFHRLGQRRHVFVTRYVVKNSVEEKMMALQERKRKVADSILAAGSDKSNSKLSLEDLAEFFKR